MLQTPFSGPDGTALSPMLEIIWLRTQDDDMMVMVIVIMMVMVIVIVIVMLSDGGDDDDDDDDDGDDDDDDDDDDGPGSADPRKKNLPTPGETHPGQGPKGPHQTKREPWADAQSGN